MYNVNKYDPSIIAEKIKKAARCAATATLTAAATAAATATLTAALQFRQRAIIFYNRIIPSHGSI